MYWTLSNEIIVIETVQFRHDPFFLKMCGRTAAFPQCGRICGAECGAGRGKCGAGKTETAKNENGSGRFWLVLLHRDRVLCALHCTAPHCTFSVCVSTQPAKNKRVSLSCGCLPVCRHWFADAALKQLAQMLCALYQLSQRRLSTTNRKSRAG